jgi:sugar phosphate isomerase/epimerase
MKIGCSSWSFRKSFSDRSLDLLGVVDLAADMGLDAIEPLSGDFPSVSKKFLHDLREALDRRSVELSAVSVGNDFAHPLAAERERQCEDVAQWIFICREIGVSCMRTFTGGAHEGVDDETAKSRVYECYARVLPAAERANLTLAVENHDAVCRSPDELVELVMHFGSPSLQLNPDPTNFLARHWEFPESERGCLYDALEKVARHASHSHLKIRDFDDAGRPTNVDVPRLLDIYRRACYDGVISFEYFGDADAKEAVAKGIAYLRPLIGG